jgi:DNA methylase/ParB-like nuclease domain
MKTQPTQTPIKISDIIVGTRHRRDLGDISALATSIATIGLLQPPAITPDGNLVAGMRRLEAVKHLGWTSIPVHVVNNMDEALQAIRGERDEDIQRKSFSVTECVSLGRELERLEKLAAQERQQAGRKRGGKARHANASVSDEANEETSSLENCQQAAPDPKKGNTRDRAGAALGMSGRTYEKACAVVVAAEKEPKRFGDLPKTMDDKRKVNRAFETLQQRQLAKERESQSCKIPGDMSIQSGDFRKLGDSVADSILDMIFTDPPYDGEAVPLYAELARFAARTLRPGGLCLAYSGQCHLPEVFAAMGEHLDYFWTFAIQLSASDGLVQGPKLRNQWKPIVAYVRKPRKRWWAAFPDFLSVTRREKDAHKWQQPTEEAEYFIKRLCPIGGVVCDPMCGSGTSLLAAARLGMQWMGFEIDKSVAKQARVRLADELKGKGKE